MARRPSWLGGPRGHLEVTGAPGQEFVLSQSRLTGGEWGPWCDMALVSNESLALYTVEGGEGVLAPGEGRGWGSWAGNWDRVAPL